MSSNLPNNNQNKNEPFEQFFRSMNDLFHRPPVRGILQHIDEFFSKPFPNTSFFVDLKEKETEHQIHAQLPGIKKEQIAISILENTVTISVKNEELILKEEKNKQAIAKKQATSKVSRTIILPYLIDEKKVKATYQNGLLIITIPKERGKDIPIK